MHTRTAFDAARQVTSKLGEILEQEEGAAVDLWTWLPSYGVAQQCHGDYANTVRPTVADVMREAAMVLSEAAGHEHTEEHEMWFTECPCGSGCQVESNDTGDDPEA